MRICEYCETEFELIKYIGRPSKYCSKKCANEASIKKRVIIKNCKYCGKEFLGLATRVNCSKQCTGMSRREHTVAQNKARRKYPEIEGLNRRQLHWRFNDKAREYNLNKDKQKRLTVIKHLGDKCARCGFKKDKRALCLDHINGDGAKDRKDKGSRTYRYYVSHLDEAEKNLQVLCYNCNAIKVYEKKENNTSRRVVNKPTIIEKGKY